jgi:hypothetical protein
MKGGTYRRGRTVVSVTSQKSNDQVYACIAISLTILFLILLPSFNLSNEIILKDSKILSKEVNDKVINIHNKNKKIDDMIHINGGEYESTVSDPSFGITLNHGINLKRKTEYCQWHEHSISHKKCTGTGDKKKMYYKKNISLY